MKARLRFQGRAGELVSSRDVDLNWNDGQTDIALTDDEVADDRWRVVVLDELEGERAGWTTIVRERPFARFPNA